MFAQTNSFLFLKLLCWKCCSSSKFLFLCTSLCFTVISQGLVSVSLLVSYCTQGIYKVFLWTLKDCFSSSVLPRVRLSRFSFFFQSWPWLLGRLLSQVGDGTCIGKLLSGGFLEVACCDKVCFYHYCMGTEIFVTFINFYNKLVWGLK